MTKMLALGVGGSSGTTTYLSDTFTDANATDLAVHTMNVGSGWTERNSSAWEISSNRAVVATFPAAQPKAVATADAGFANYTASVVVGYGDAGNASPGLVLRYGVADGKHYLVIVADSGNEFSIYEWDGASFTQRATATVAIAANTSYTLQAVCSGDTITAKLDGANEISYGSATVHNTSTLVGVRDSQINNNTFDTFLVTS